LLQHAALRAQGTLPILQSAAPDRCGFALHDLSPFKRSNRFET
jgi:hypothetical protein